MIGLVQIRNTSEAVDPKGVYTVFNVYVNGVIMRLQIQSVTGSTSRG